MKGHFFPQVEIIITKQQKYLDEILKSSPQPLVEFQPNLAYGILGLSSFTFVQIKGRVPFQGEKIKKQQIKLNEQNLNIFFSRTRSITSKLSTMYMRVREIQTCSTEGPRPSPRGDIIAK